MGSEMCIRDRVKSGMRGESSDEEDEEIECEAAMFMCDDYQMRSDFEAYRGLQWGKDGALELAGKHRVSNLPYCRPAWAADLAQRRRHIEACFERTKQLCHGLQPASSVLSWRLQLFDAHKEGEPTPPWVARVQYGTKVVQVALPYLEDPSTSEEDVADTLLHEAAHILVHGASGIHLYASYAYWIF